jgi:predicted transcriptional regulator
MADNLKALTASIVASYVESNKIAAADLASLIQSTFTALSEAGRPAIAETEAIAKPTAAQIRKSITPDALISFIDGKPYRMLKRHLTTHGLTAKTYQERYGLPLNYPMTAPSYSAARSALATKMGLGRKAAPVPAASAPVTGKLVAKAVSKSQPGEKAGPGARVPKAVRSTKARDIAEGGSS